MKEGLVRKDIRNKTKEILNITILSIIKVNPTSVKVYRVTGTQ